MDTFAHLLMPNYGEEEESSSIQLDATFAASSTSSIDGHFHTTRTSSSLTRRPSYLKTTSRSSSLLSSGIGWGKRALSVLVETGCGEQHAEAVASLDDDEYNFPGRDDVAAALRPYKFCSTKGSSLLRTRTWSSTTTCSTEESNLSDEETTSSSWSSSLPTREAQPDESEEGASAATSWTTEVQESADADDGGNEKRSGDRDDEIRVSTDDSSTLESKGDANTVLSDATTVRASGSCPAWIIEVLDGNLQELSVSEPIRFRLFRPGNLSFTVLEGAEILGRIQSLLDSTPEKRLVFCLNFRRARRKLWLHADEIMDELRDILGRCGTTKNKPSCPRKQQSSNSLFFARRRRNFDFHDATRSVMSHCTTAFEGGRHHHHGKYWIGRRMRSSFGSKISNRCEV